MTPGERRFSRRVLIVGAGAGATLAAYELSRLADDGDRPHTHPNPGSSTTPPAETSPGAVDLTVRWRHLERRVAMADLLAGWHFDEGSGYAFTDVTDAQRRLVITGSAWNTTDSGLLSAIHRRGMRGSSVYLDGTRWLETAPSTNLRSADGVTVTCWLRLDVLPRQTALIAGLGGGWRMTLDPSGVATLTIVDAAGATHTVHTPNGAVAAGRWTQLSATAEPTGADLRLFVDGTQVAHTATPHFTLSGKPAGLVVGNQLTGALDELTIHRVALTPAALHHLYVVGLPKVFTQTSESIDEAREVFTTYKGSDPIPHPVATTTVLTHRFDDSMTTDQGARPLVARPASALVPGAFGGAWRATSNRLSYHSPLTGDSGTFEAWCQAITDPADPERRHRKEIFTASGPTAGLTLYSESGRWKADVRRQGHPLITLSAAPSPLAPLTLEHVGVTWGSQSGGRHGVALYVNGVPVAFRDTSPGDTTFAREVGLGGTAAAPTYCLLVDVRISDTALAWGEVCPRGQATTEAAGLDLRDRFDRPPASGPMLWRPASATGQWSHRRMTWQNPAATGADPTSVLGLFQGATTGLQSISHPDATGHASSIEAGVAFPTAADGWAGLFVASPAPQGAFSGLTFMLNPADGLLRLARYEQGKITAAKVLPHDFAITPRTTYELTLTCAGDGLMRGFVDGTNVLSLRFGVGWPTQGYAGMVTDDSQAFFGNLHFCALTPATASSRVIRTSVLRYGTGADVAALELVPFRWHKRRGLLPWQYTSKNPEPAGNIAGADTLLPPRPIASAPWRSEDSANTDLITLNGRIFAFMRGNPRVDGSPAAARIGVLHAAVPLFDGTHFVDPNTTTTGGNLLISETAADADTASGPGTLDLNAPSTAYVGDGTLLFFGRESTLTEDSPTNPGQLVYSRFNLHTGAWEHPMPHQLDWSVPRGSAPANTDRREMHGSPELVSLRRPEDDRYQVVVFQQTGALGKAVMAAAILTDVSDGVPRLAPGLPIHTSVSRPSGGAIYGFRVMFDNGIYYLHVNDGPQVPDWPERFLLGATLDPYAGPWVLSPTSVQSGSTYFSRGTELEPDNGAIWQGTMFKHRGCYYLYYENYHSIGDVDAQYADYNNVQAGSRVGFATA